MKSKEFLTRLLVIISIVSIAYVSFQIVKDKNEEKNNTTTNSEIIEKEENNNVKEEDNTSDQNTTNDIKTEDTTTNTKTEEPLKNETEENKQEKSDNVTVSIELVGEEEINLNVGDTYKEYGAKAIDSNGNDVSSQIQIDNSVDTSKKGEYTVIYSIGNSIVIRTVKVN